MLRTLVAKDLRRAWRNPVPWLISLVVPFVFTALIGAVFGNHGGGGGLGTITVAFVDEDDTGLGEFLQSALERTRTSDNDQNNRPPFDLQLVQLDRTEAVRRLTNDEFAAAVILPKGFTDGLLSTDGRAGIELIKNPARAIQPRVVEESLGLLVTALNSLRAIGGDSLGEVRQLVVDDDDFLTKLALGATLLTGARDRLEPVKDYLVPPLVSYTEETRTDQTVQSSNSNADIFAFLLVGMSAMFLLYLVDNAMRDLYREMRARTLERFKTLHEGLLAFVGGKVLFAVAIGLLGALILLGGGALAFQFTWRQPLPLAVLAFAYVFCGAGLLGLIGALAGAERRADVLNNVIIMMIAVCGGCMFPPSALPPFMRDTLLPLLPTGWFASAARALQDGDMSGAWMMAALKLVLMGVVTLLAATFLFRKRLEQGVRA